MSQKKDENFFADKDKEEDNVKCSPLQNVVPFEEEKEEITPLTDTQDLAAEEAGIERRRWKLAYDFLGVILIVTGLVLGIMLRPEYEPTPTPPEPAPPEPTLLPEVLGDLLSSVSSDGGKALRNTSTPQNKAFNWLAANKANLGTYTNIIIIQRYALATLYFSTNGDNWRDNAFWLDDDTECRWHPEHLNCTDAGFVAYLDLEAYNLNGNIPPEIGLLSSLGKFIIEERMILYYECTLNSVATLHSSCD